jgi:hypothetical protein
MSATKLKKKVGCKNPKGSQQRRDGRSGRREIVNEKRWWWVRYRWNGTPSETRETSLQAALKAADDRAQWEQVTDIEVEGVEVVERRVIVKRLKTTSPIDPKLSDCGGWRGACPNCGTQMRLTKVEEARDEESTRRDSRSSSLERMVRRFGDCGKDLVLEFRESDGVKWIELGARSQRK